MTADIRIVLVEDHPLVAAGLRATLDRMGYEIVAQPRTLAEARALGVRDRPGAARRLDLAIVDVELPDGSGLEVVSEWSALGVPCVVLTGHTTASRVRAARAAGALGFVAKTAPLGTILEALAAAMRGEPYLCRVAQVTLENEEEDVALTPRESQVLAYIAAGRSNKQIAALLRVAPRTVETHRERLMEKLAAHNAADLTRAAMHRGLLRRS